MPGHGLNWIDTKGGGRHAKQADVGRARRFAAGGGGVTGQAMGKPQETVGRKAMGATAFRRYASPAAGIFASAFWQRKGEI